MTAARHVTVVGIVCATTLLAGCSRGHDNHWHAPTPTRTPGTPTSPGAATATTSTSSPSAPASPRAATLQPWERGLTQVAAQQSARLGIAWVDGGGLLHRSGTVVTGPAWSTIKVPLSVAALQASPTDATRAHVRQAVTISSNDDAEALWSSLGGDASAAPKVERVLAACGDTTTHVLHTKVRPEFSSFGQTQWRLQDQVQCLRHLASVPRGGEVLALMGQVAASQSWGLGTLEGARFKGGWGPTTAGRYECRQMGLVPVQGKTIAVAIAAAPSSGTQADCARALTAVASWWHGSVAINGIPTETARVLPDPTSGRTRPGPTAKTDRPDETYSTP